MLVIPSISLKGTFNFSRLIRFLSLESASYPHILRTKLDTCKSLAISSVLILCCFLSSLICQKSAYSKRERLNLIQVHVLLACQGFHQYCRGIEKQFKKIFGSDPHFREEISTQTRFSFVQTFLAY